MPMTFEEFMQRALHDPQHGYYARHIPSIGGRGDFTTAPMLNHDLARAIAAWVHQALRAHRCRHLIEIGPGTGALMQQVRRHLPWNTRWTTQLHCVESSPHLTAIQQDTLGRKHAQWHTTMPSALNACDGRAVIFSNELVDAFPVRRFRKTQNPWHEIAVDIAPDGRANESLMPVAHLPSSSIFQRDFTHNQAVEVHESYHQWIQQWMPAWKAGRMLTIDYGARANDLYHRQPDGSIRAYLLHQRLTGPAIYQHPGRQDITADVNFTDLIEWSDPWLHTSRLITLGEFLGADAHPALTDPDGAGAAFLILEQHPRGDG